MKAKYSKIQKIFPEAHKPLKVLYQVEYDRCSKSAIILYFILIFTNLLKIYLKFIDMDRSFNLF